MKSDEIDDRKHLSIETQAGTQPENGMVVIDSDFNLFTEQAVKCDQGELGMLFRAFVRPEKPLTFKFTLRRNWKSGVVTAHEQLSRVASLGWDASDVERKRREIAGQTAMIGIIAVLQSDARQALDAPTTDNDSQACPPPSN